MSNIVAINTYKIALDSEKVDTPKVWDLVNRYSAVDRLLRITAYCLRFISKILRNHVAQKGRKFQVISTNYFRLDLVSNPSLISACEIANAQFF